MDLRHYRRAANKLRGLPGLVGAFRGLRHRKSRWTREPTLTLFVRRKLPKAGLGELCIPKKIDGISTDVIALGRPRLHADVDSMDRVVSTYDGRGRKSAISTMVRHPNGGMMVLGSGHGLLPIKDGDYVSGRWQAGDLDIDVDDEQDVEAGGVWFGAVGGNADFAVARFRDLEPPAGLNGHILASAPIRLFLGRLEKGDAVQHVAPLRGYRIGGVVVADSVAPMTLHGEDGIGVEYDGLVAVASDSIAFSVKTESGSLVFDSERRAVGFIVGGGRDPDKDLSVSFVHRDFATLANHLGELFGLFFRRKDK